MSPLRPGGGDDAAFPNTVAAEDERSDRRPLFQRGPGGSGPVVLVARVAGRARLAERLGEAETGHALKRCLKRVEQAAAGYRGQLVRHTDDGLVVVFETPAAALLAACRMQRAVVDLPPVSGIKPALKTAFDQAADGLDALPLADIVDAVLALARRARPEQILTRAVLLTTLPPKLRHLVSCGATAAGGERDAGVCEILWRELGETAAYGDESPGSTAQPTRLWLRHRGRELVVEPGRAPLGIGRDAHCDIVVLDARGSRQHARIEWRNNRFVLVDLSLNGTFVGFAGMASFLLKRDEAVLHGAGRLLCGHNDGSDDEEFVAFEVLGE